MQTDVLREAEIETVAETVMKKLEDFFTSLNDGERGVVSEMVHASLIQAACAGSSLPEFAKGLNGRNAPNLVASVSVPGSVLAYSNVNCGFFTVRGTSSILPG